MPDNDIEDEEINIDFSKIKNMFKKKKEAVPRQDTEEDEISFDFSKVKGFFRNMKKGLKDEGKKDQEDMAVDYKKIIAFTKKHYIFFLILIPLILSIYLRAMPAYLPVTDEWAESQLYNMNKNIISQQIRAQYPNLPSANINKLVNDEIENLIKNNEILVPSPQGIQKAPYKEALAQYSQSFKSRLQKDGQTYLLAIDPYFWMRHAENVLENSHPGDELRNPETREPCSQKNENCVPWNTHMFAPLGRQVPHDMFHAYFMAYFHNFLSIFNSEQDIMSSAFIIPVLLSALAVIPAFFIARKIAGNFGGLLAALFVAIHPAFLTRTAGGFADTDAYNVLLPLLIVWLFLEAFETKDWKKSTVLSMGAGLLVALFSMTWGGWWYIFDFLLASLVIYIAIYLLTNRAKLKNILKHQAVKHSLLVLAVFFLSSMFFTSIISGLAIFNNAFEGPGTFARLKEVGISKVWPNVYTTVAEQNPASLNNVINQIGTGSLFLFLFAILGVVLTLVKQDSRDKKDLVYFILSAIWLVIILAVKPQNLIIFLVLISLPILIKLILAVYSRNTEIDFKLAIILIIWFTSTIYASTKGIRYMLLLVPAFSIALGVLFGFAYNYISAFIHRNLDLNKKLAKTIIIILLLLFLIRPFNSAASTAKREIPSMNDAWYESLDKINREASADAIINSWWDFGHWFKAIGDRAVTFDGTSQNTPMAHWIGYTLLTSDEDEAVGILRMLDCGSNTAFNILDKDIGDTAKSVEILHETVRLNEEEAKSMLSDYVDEATADEILKYTHCESPENYYITSDDMIGKSGVWGHFGIWDFNRALIYNKLKNKEFRNNKEKSIEFMQNRFNYTYGKAESLYFAVQNIRNSDEANSWIAPWPSYASGLVACQQQGAGIIICPIRVQQGAGTLDMRIDIENKEAEIKTPQQSIYPNAIVYPTETGIEKIEFDNNTIGYSMTLVPSENGWQYIMMLPPLEDSMFTRLYFLDGHGLTKFRKFSEQQSVVGNKILVWKVEWQGKEKNIMDFFVPKNVTEEEEEESINITEELLNSSVSESKNKSNLTGK
ncbi:hypothetical protein GF323_04280 [Candidatus Woesearchaeota archaeon]|nr:hypothetical protein [Candidatus Woesearchaeota archaeon]